MEVSRVKVDRSAISHPPPSCLKGVDGNRAVRGRVHVGNVSVHPWITLETASIGAKTSACIVVRRRSRSKNEEQRDWTHRNRGGPWNPTLSPKMLVKSMGKRRKRTARKAKEGSKKRPRKEHVPRPSSHPIEVRGKPIGHIYSG
eukprot:scaffold2858_cov659-Pavlova_lutheri.AAC.162